MNVDMTPQFARLCELLRRVAWFSNVGRSTPLILPFPYRFVASASVAKREIERPEWEDWTLERRNDLTTFLHDRFPNRDADWNRIAKSTREVIENDIAPVALPVLVKALPGSAVAADAMRWDLAGALMEAAYAACQPPLFFTHLIVAYEAGHLPVGWDEDGEGTLLVY